MHRVFAAILLAFAVGVAVFTPIPLCLAQTTTGICIYGFGQCTTVCIVPNPILILTGGLNPNYVLAAVLGFLGILVLASKKAKRRGSVFLSTGIFGILGLVIIMVAVLSLILGVVIGASLFSGFAVGLPGGTFVLQPWQTAIILAVIGFAFLFAGMRIKNLGGRRG